MKLLANLRMKRKLALLLVFPLAGMLYFSVSGIVEKTLFMAEAERLHGLTDIASRIDAVAHHLQLERGISVLYLGAEGEKHTGELQSQRTGVDKEIAGLREFLDVLPPEQFGSALRRQLDDALTGFDALKTKRGLISALKIHPDETIDFFSGAIASLLNVVTSISKLSGDAEIARIISANVNLVQAKEIAGQERAFLAGVFSSDGFSPGAFQKFVSLAAEQDAYLKVFLNLATSEQREYFMKKHVGQCVDEVARIRKVVSEKAGEGKFGVDPAYWFGMQTGRMEILKEVEDSLLRDMSSRADSLIKEARISLCLFIAVTVIIFLATLALAYVISLGITRPLAASIGVANRLALGDVAVKVDVDRGDEAGQLLRAMANMVESIKGNAALAASIAAGDLSAKAVFHSEADVLGHALDDMIECLRAQLRDIQEAVTVLTASSSEIVSTTAQLASGTGQTAVAASQTMATVEEVKQTVNVAAQKARHVSTIAQNAVQVSQTGTKLVDETVDGIHRFREQMEYIAETILRLSEHNQAIGEIIITVDDLAEQSNLLAVNAAIEAAKVGEYGKGFIVVAQEIKNLAEQSKQATKQVRTILNDIQKASGAAVMATEKGSKAVEAAVQQSSGTGDSIRELTGIISEASQAVTQIATSSQQQLVGMDQVVLAMNSIKQATSQNAVSTKQVEVTVKGLQELGQKLKKSVERYKI